MEDFVKKFVETGRLLDGTYYFDPPLGIDEMHQLNNLLKNAANQTKSGKSIILRPITGGSGSQKLVYFEISHGQYGGWQDVDVSDDDMGDFVIKDLTSIKRFCGGPGGCKKPFRNGRLFFEIIEKVNTEDIFGQLDESVNYVDYVDKFFETGELMNGSYYFDPPLSEPEIIKLHAIFKNIGGSKIILNPLSRDTQETGNYNNNRTLLWLDVHLGRFSGWQNVDWAEDNQGDFKLNNLDSIKRWCDFNRDCEEPLRNGRLFLEPLPNTEDIFNQLNESESNFDPEDLSWVNTDVPELSNLSGQELYNTIQNYFKTHQGGKYWLKQEDGMVWIYDDTGIYYDINLDDFTVEELVQRLNFTLKNVYARSVANEYIELAKALEPIIGPIDPPYEHITESYDLGWAEDIVSGTFLPPVGGKRYLLLFDKKPDAGYVRTIFNNLVTLGWQTENELESTIRAVDGYRKKFVDTYIHLAPEGFVSFGSEISVFKRVYGNDAYQEAIKISV